MRRLADRLVNWLLSHAPWYRPEAIAAREAHTERVRRQSIAARTEAEMSARVGAYDRVRIGRHGNGG